MRSRPVSDEGLAGGLHDLPTAYTVKALMEAVASVAPSPSGLQGRPEQMPIGTALSLNLECPPPLWSPTCSEEECPAVRRGIRRDPDAGTSRRGRQRQGYVP